jgi:hypothetical protein
MRYDKETVMKNHWLLLQILRWEQESFYFHLGS